MIIEQVYMYEYGPIIFEDRVIYISFCLLIVTTRQTLFSVDIAKIQKTKSWCLHASNLSSSH